MKYYKFENGFGTQPNNIIPSYATEITEEEYYQLVAEIEAKQKSIADYTEKVKAGEMTLEEVPEEYKAEVEANTIEIIDPTNYVKPEEGIPEGEPLYTLDEVITQKGEK